MNLSVAAKREGAECSIDQVLRIPYRQREAPSSRWAEDFLKRRLADRNHGKGYWLLGRRGWRTSECFCVPSRQRGLLMIWQREGMAWRVREGGRGKKRLKTRGNSLMNPPHIMHHMHGLEKLFCELEADA